MNITEFTHGQMDAFRAAIAGNNLEKIVDLISFEDRDDYIAWRKRWRQDYRNLSDTIRRLKASCKGPGDHSIDQMRRHGCRVTARAMMVLRAASKAKARASRVPKPPLAA